MTYERQIATARRLIAQKGEACIWRVMTLGNPVIPGQDWKPTNPDEADIPKHNVNIVWVPESAIRAMFDTVIPVAKYYGLMSEQSFLPSINDSVQSTSGRVKVEWLTELNPNGVESVLWALAAGDD